MAFQPVRMTGKQRCFIDRRPEYYLATVAMAPFKQQHII
jgi:hypothetical protein